jgi:hypothetical protein
LCLIANAGKSDAIVFSSPGEHINVDTCPKIVIGGEPLNYVSETKFLGVLINENIISPSQIYKTKNSILSGIALIGRVKWYVGVDMLIKLYHAYVGSHINYCLEFYGLNYQSHMEQLLKAQKKCIRAVLGIAPWKCATIPMVDLRILPVTYQIKFICCLYIYKVLSNKLPNFLNIQKCQVIETRGSNSNLCILKGSTCNTGRFSMINLGIVYWNELPCELRSAKISILTFKKKLKNYFIGDIKFNHVC